jgi:hypothetical protein
MHLITSNINNISETQHEAMSQNDALQCNLEAITAECVAHMGPFVWKPWRLLVHTRTGSRGYTQSNTTAVKNRYQLKSADVWNLWLVENCCSRILRLSVADYTSL